MASQVRSGSRCPRNSRENSAVTSGPSAIITNTLATLVIVMATMKAVYISAQQRPEIQTGQRACSNVRQAPGPRMTVSAITSAKALNKLRQNVTSKLRAPSS